MRFGNRATIHAATTATRSLLMRRAITHAQNTVRSPNAIWMIAVE